MIKTTSGLVAMVKTSLFSVLSYIEPQFGLNFTVQKFSDQARHTLKAFFDPASQRSETTEIEKIDKAEGNYFFILCSVVRDLNYRYSHKFHEKKNSFSDIRRKWNFTKYD